MGREIKRTSAMRKRKTTAKIPAKYTRGTVHPVTGEKMVCVEWEARCNVIELHLPPPIPADGSIWAWDEASESYGFVRKKTARELKRDEAAYKREAAHYAKTGGVARSPGPVKVTGRFKTRSGKVCEGVWEGVGWIWVVIGMQSRAA